MQPYLVILDPGAGESFRTKSNNTTAFKSQPLSSKKSQMTVHQAIHFKGGPLINRNQMMQSKMRKLILMQQQEAFEK